MYAYITKSAKFFPNEPVSNDEMESYLGMVDNKPSKARRIVLKRNGIKQRYYAPFVIFSMTISGSMILTCYPVEQPLPNSLYPHME